MEAGNVGLAGQKNFGAVVHDLKGQHARGEIEGPLGQHVSALAKTKHGPLPPPPVESTNSTDTVDIQSSPLQTTSVAVLNAVNETFGSNLTLSTVSEEPLAVTEEVADETLSEADDSEVTAIVEEESSVVEGDGVNSMAELAVGEAAQEIVSLTTSLFNPETDQIDSFYNALSTAIEAGFKDGLASFSSTEDVEQILGTYELVQQGIDAFYQEQAGSEPARVWQDLTPTPVEVVESTVEGSDTADDPIEEPEAVEGQAQAEPELLPEYVQIQSLLDDPATDGFSVEA
ncbi:MAG: hypothetical protein ACPF9K_11340 [Neptuniibacter sp.]